MRRIVIGASLLLSIAGLAQTQMSTGNFTTNPDKSVQVLELNTARGGALKLACVNGQLEVGFQPQLKLPATSNVQVSYRFDNSALVVQRWNVGPFGGTLFLPSNLTRGFLNLGADATTLSMSFADGGRVTQQFRFAVTGFRQALSSLTCAAQYGFAPSMTMTPTKNPFTVLDRNMAFIAPAEFVKIFENGGIFQPEGSFLAWEFNGVKLLLQKNSTAVQSVFDNRSITLMRPVVEVSGRTVVPANLVSAFDCKVIGITQASDAKVKIGCGAGQSYVENELTRY